MSVSTAKQLFIGEGFEGPGVNLAAGVNFIDLADFYSTGVGEEVVGRILKRIARREEIVVTTKVGYDMGAYQNAGGHSRKHVMDTIDASLTRLGMDYVDIYMLHFFDVNTPVEETRGALNDIVCAGKARYIGVSTMYTWQFAKIVQMCERNGWHKPINMQLQLNLAYREEEHEMIPYCQDQGVGVSVFSPLACGLLTCEPNSTRNQTDFFAAQMYGDTVSREIAASVARVAARRGVSTAQTAQAWVLNHGGVASMLVGADTPAQFDSALAALGTKLSADELFELERNYTPCDLINDYTAGKRIAREARLAQGVFNIVSGDAVAIGGVLTESEVVRKLSFTGSTRVGKLLAKQSADTLKKLSLELGGNAPFIVFDDADIDAAVQGAMASKFRNTGQTCVCVNRFHVQDGIYDAFTQALTQAVRKMRVGNALQGEVEQGPLINQAALKKVETHVADALQKGANVLTGGKPHALGGTFYEPTVLIDASKSMVIAAEETFGPVAACFRFKTEDEAIAAANDTPFGLSAYFYTRDLARAWRVAEAVGHAILAEFSPRKHRGTLLGSFSVVWTIGYVVANVLGMQYADASPDAWRWLLRRPAFPR